MINVKVRGYTGQGWGSGLIQWFTRSKVSHVSLVFHLGHIVDEIEAIQGKGVVRHTPYTPSEKEFIEFDLPLTYEQVLEAHELACSLVGAKYDWKCIRSFVQHRKKHSLDKWICSEIVAYVLLKAGYPISRKEPFLENPSSVTDSLRLLEPVKQVGGA